VRIAGGAATVPVAPGWSLGGYLTFLGFRNIVPAASRHWPPVAGEVTGAGISKEASRPYGLWLPRAGLLAILVGLATFRWIVLSVARK